MQSTLIRPLVYGPTAGPDRDGETAEIGTVIDNSDAHTLVLNGDALPADRECAEACFRELFSKAVIDEALTEQQLKLLSSRIEGLVDRKHPVAAGIHPDDYEAFRSGEMTGYDPETGEPIPGPNFVYDGPIELV